MLHARELNKGLIFTETEGCINCNKCIHECPILTSNVSAVDKNGTRKMCVDEKECILCGTCVDTCIHNVRHYSDDTSAFLQELKQGRSFTVLIAPSFYLNYPDAYEYVLGYLQSLGVTQCYPVSLGAEITIWGYMKYLQSTEATGIISQPCPSVVSHIEKHLPELLSKIIPVQSPLMCTAIYLRKYKNVTDDFVFLSPCIAKKTEINSKRGMGLVRHNVTFKNLMQHIKENEIELKKYPAAKPKTDTIAGMGSLFPKPGGLREILEYYMGRDARIMHVEGEQKIYKYLSSLAANRENQSALPLLIDALNCQGGCILGTGTAFRKTDNYTVTHQALHINGQQLHMHRVANEHLNAAEEFETYNAQFSHLTYEDFLCTYETDVQKRIYVVAESDIEKIFKEQLHKLTDNDMHVDCAACGYGTCSDMAQAIALGINYPDSCVYYVRNLMARSEEKMRLLFNNMPLVAAFLRLDFSVGECNDEAIKLFDLRSKEDFVNNFQKLSPRYQPDGSISKAQAKKMLFKAYTEGQVQFSWMHQKLSREQIPCEITLIRSNLHGEEGVLTFIRDMRAYHEYMAGIESALNREQEANRAKSVFLSNMSHEMRTPMNAIIGMTAIGRADATAERKDYAFEKIENASTHLLGVVNNVLDMAKIEAGKLILTSVPFSLKKLIDRVVDIVDLLRLEKEQDINVWIDPQIPEYVSGDDQRLAQALLNLVINAIKFTTEGGNIKIQARLLEKSEANFSMQLVVIDTGIGIKREQLNRLFAPFEQAEVSTSREYGGTGLGLPITKSIVELMGGEIHVESTVDVGTTFYMTIPLEYAEKKEEKEINKIISTAGMFKGFRVLVVEDVDINREILQVQLEETGIQIDFAVDGLMAVKIAEWDINDYDIILMDIQMPVMDGIKATCKIRAMDAPKAKTIPILAMTANVFAENINDYIACGMNDHIGKPIDYQLLLEKMSQYLLK